MHWIFVYDTNACLIAIHTTPVWYAMYLYGRVNRIDPQTRHAILTEAERYGYTVFELRAQIV